MDCASCDVDVRTALQIWAMAPRKQTSERRWQVAEAQARWREASATQLSRELSPGAGDAVVTSAAGVLRVHMVTMVRCPMITLSRQRLTSLVPALEAGRQKQAYCTGASVAGLPVLMHFGWPKPPTLAPVPPARFGVISKMMLSGR